MHMCFARLNFLERLFTNDIDLSSLLSKKQFDSNHNQVIIFAIVHVPSAFHPVLNDVSMTSIFLRPNVTLKSLLTLERNVIRFRTSLQRKRVVLECEGQTLQAKYIEQEGRFEVSGVLYFGWPNQPSSGTMRFYIGLLLCTYNYIW